MTLNSAHPPTSGVTQGAQFGGEVTVTPMRRRHLRGVLRIENEVYPRPWSLGLYMSELALRSQRFYVVARSGGDVVGYGGLMFSGGDAHVTTLAVAPGWHRRKVGTRLLAVLARHAIERGSTNLTLEVRVTNDSAKALYSRFGFAPAGIRRNYYAEVNEDALVMWATGIDAPSYAERIDRIEAGLPGDTVLEGL